MLVFARLALTTVNIDLLFLLTFREQADNSIAAVFSVTNSDDDGCGKKKKKSGFKWYYAVVSFMDFLARG